MHEYWKITISFRKVVIISLLFIIVFQCASCDSSKPQIHVPRRQYICKEQGVKKDCSSQEIRMIDGINSVLDRVRFEGDNIDINDYLIRGSFDHLYESRVIMLGEAHDRVNALIEDLMLLNRLTKLGDVILLEGLDRKFRPKQKCGLFLAYQIYKMWEWNQLNYSYEPTEFLRFSEQQRFLEMLEATQNSYDLSGLKLNLLECAAWDDDESLSESFITYDNVTTRNESMVKAIKYQLFYYNRIFVKAGLRHLPLGDYFIFSLGNLNQMDSLKNRPKEKDYKLMKQKNERTFLGNKFYGTTKVVNDYFMQKDKFFSLELINKKHFY